MEFGPQKIDIKEVGINSIGALIAGVVGSVIILILTVVLSGFINITESFASVQSTIGEKSAIFPFVLSVITFISTSITIFISYFFMNLVNPDKYKKNIIIFSQLAFITFFIYLFLFPAYIYFGLLDYNYIMMMFLLHTIFVIFGTSLLVEILNNYRYVLVGFYGSFLGLLISIIISSLIFTGIDGGETKLFSLLFLLPLIVFIQIFIKGIFELGYYHYNIFTNKDQIGDIFYQIELEEQQALREQEEKNTI